MAIYIITDLPAFRMIVDITDHCININNYILIDKVWKSTGGIALNNKELETIYNLRK